MFVNLIRPKIGERRDNSEHYRLFNSYYQFLHNKRQIEMSHAPWSNDTILVHYFDCCCKD